LRVCDPAVGSGAILVAACRYLADRLVEAWIAEGSVPDGYAPDPDTLVDEDEVTVLARRAVADQCIYGVDRDPMAVEMAKLSLWLTTMSRERPFTFVDHAIRAGDSLLGLTSLDQITAFHMDPDRGRKLHKDLFVDLQASLKPLVDEVLELRGDISALPVITVRDVESKTEMNARAEHLLETATAIADTIVGATLCSGGKDKRLDNLLLAVQPTVLAALQDPTSLSDLRTLADEMLNRGRPSTVPMRQPLHWVLAFPDVLYAGGFDAMVGNPPFLRGKAISGNNGGDYRNSVHRWLAEGRPGSADLVAYFFLMASRVASSLGFIATNSVGQGDTREVGLDSMTSCGWTIFRADPSRPWPGAAGVSIAVVWATAKPWRGAEWLAGDPVPAITSGLRARGRAEPTWNRLVSGGVASYYGTVISGSGFILTEAEKSDILARSPQEALVIRPYLTGDDLLNRPEGDASRSVIDFGGLSEREAQRYPLCFERVRRLVKPQRDRVKRKSYRERWWQFAERCEAMYAATQDLSRAIAFPQTGKYLVPRWVETGQVFAQSLIVIPSQEWCVFGLLASSVHTTWVAATSGTLETRPTYRPTDSLETFPFPPELTSLSSDGEALGSDRDTVVRGRWLGLTATYNLVNDPDCADNDVKALRDAHVSLDESVLAAYGWDDLETRHGFYESAQGCRFTIHPMASVELLDRLLELNQARFADEQAAGLHTTSTRAKPASRRTAKEQMPSHSSPPPHLF
jgi:hypothetical protein